MGLTNCFKDMGLEFSKSGKVNKAQEGDEGRVRQGESSLPPMDPHYSSFSHFLMGI